MDAKSSSPRIAHLSSGRLDVEGEGRFKDAKLYTDTIPDIVVL